MGQRKWPATPLPECGRENAGAVTGLEQRNALARRLHTLRHNTRLNKGIPFQQPGFSYRRFITAYTDTVVHGNAGMAYHNERPHGHLQPTKPDTDVGPDALRQCMVIDITYQ